MLAYVNCFVRVITKEKIKNKVVAIFFLLMCLARLRVLLLRIFRCNGELKTTQFWIENYFTLLINFSESYFVSIDETIFLATQNKWRREHLHHVKMDLEINIPGKHRQLSHTFKWTKHYLASSRGKILSFEKRFEGSSHDDEKRDLICLSMF